MAVVPVVTASVIRAVALGTGVTRLTGTISVWPMKMVLISSSVISLSGFRPNDGLPPLAPPMPRSLRRPVAAVIDA